VKHTLNGIGCRPLHPTESLVIAVLTGKGLHVRQCGCGMLIAAADELDIRRKYLDHYAAARAVAE
jgi:hypothetical protein